MAINLGSFAHTHSTPFGSSTTATTGSVTTAASGSTFVICTNTKSQTISSVTDSKGNTYVQKASGTLFNTANIYVCDGGTGGSGHTATLTMSAADSFCFFFIELTGAANPSVDVTGNGSNNDSGLTTVTGASVTTTFAPDLILSLIGCFGSTATITDSGTGFAFVDKDVTDGVPAGAVSYAIKSATGTYSDTYTQGTGNFNSFAAVAFKEQGAGDTLMGQAWM